LAISFSTLLFIFCKKSILYTPRIIKSKDINEF